MSFDPTVAIVLWDSFFVLFVPVQVFDKQADAELLMGYTKQLSDRAVSINEGEANEEISFCDLETCRHDEGLPCTGLERVEIRTL